MANEGGVSVSKGAKSKGEKGLVSKGAKVGKSGSKSVRGSVRGRAVEAEANDEHGHAPHVSDVDGASGGVYVARLKKLYLESGRKRLMEKFHYTNSMQVPRLKKIVVSVGVKEAAVDVKAAEGAKVMEKAVGELFLITGQKPVVTRARKSIAAFKVRAGSMLGCKVTLRGDRMYEFLDRLTNIALPRVRDFRGLDATCIRNASSFTFGLKEQTIFPEIEYDKVDKMRGMNVTIVSTATTSAEMRTLLEIFDVPFYD